jgi:hypothetical protein
MTLRPGTGAHQRGDANPGVLYIGDVGLHTFEDLNVATGPGLNFGWPLYEGLEAQPSYRNSNVPNQDAPNPLFGSGGCTQQYFYFRNLLVQDTLNVPSWPNPCNTGQQVPATLFRFVHTRPAIDWQHETGPARTGVYAANGTALVTNIGAPGSPVSGPQFGGTSSIGGTWYMGDDFPALYKNTYFNGDYEGQWIRNFVFDTNNRPVEVRPFLSEGGGIVAIATHPVEGNLYYVTWTNGIWRIRYTGNGNLAPKAVASANKKYGPSPLAVSFDGAASVDPEGQPLLYQWNFGDGSLVSTHGESIAYVHGAGGCSDALHDHADGHRPFQRHCANHAAHLREQHASSRRHYEPDQRHALSAGRRHALHVDRHRVRRRTQCQPACLRMADDSPSQQPHSRGAGGYELHDERADLPVWLRRRDVSLHHHSQGDRRRRVGDDAGSELVSRLSGAAGHPDLSRAGRRRSYPLAVIG